MGRRKVGQCKYEERDYELVYTNAETRTDTYTLGEILEDLEAGNIIDSIAEQRDADMWSLKDKSMLVHTVLFNLSILPISLTQQGTGKGAKKILSDGKQRLTSLAQFKNNEYVLSSNTPHVRMRRIVKTPKLDENGKVVKAEIDGKKRPVMVPCKDENGEIITEEFDYKVAGKYFDELPDALKYQFMHYKNMPQYVHINYTPEEFQMQMLRDNTSVKMTPAQIGAVLCGNALAEWLRDFRMNDLFLNYTTWSSNQESKSLIERCVVEGFVLTLFREKWNAQYLKNVDIFKENANEGYLETYKDIINDFVNVIKKYPSLKGHLTKDNLHIIIAAYSHFCDMSTRYKQDDFGKFLCNWFDEIKDTTNYEVQGNAGTKQKTNILTKLSIINEKCAEYMENYGNVDDVHDDEDFEEDEADCETLNNFVEAYGENKECAACALMEIDSRTAYADDFTPDNIKKYIQFFNQNPSEDLANKCLDIQDKILNVQTEDESIINKYNLPIFIKLYDKCVYDVTDNNLFLQWLKAFGDAEEPAFVEIGGKIFADYNSDDVDQTSNATIVSKYAVLLESYEDYIEKSMSD